MSIPGEIGMETHVEMTARRFDRWAGKYGQGRISSWFRHFQQLGLTQLALRPGERFLDVGCGTGWAVEQAAAQLGDGIACGLDISPRMIEEAQRQSSSAGTEFHLGSADRLPFADETFHALLCSCSFHHYAQPLAALSEFRRVLYPAGRLLLIDAARDVSWAMWLQDRWRRSFEKSHVCYYTTGEMRNLFAEANLQVEEVNTVRRIAFKGKLFTGLMLCRCRKE
jgi:ubiquinone/menaquinone biosynthesis C-methylase UbiE